MAYVYSNKIIILFEINKYNKYRDKIVAYNKLAIRLTIKIIYLHLQKYLFLLIKQQVTAL